ncbi:MAG: hypothetical protein D6756_03200 [Cyanobacteria bacterium J083]|nr:MAG: hypothetical protein D6756_03200 [Cyanobacteria bacterium J083]
MDAFDPTPPVWTNTATHSLTFTCPSCGASVQKAKKVWLNRRAPVTIEGYRRKYQEFYQCECEQSWWAWSNDRPPTNLTKSDGEPLP